MGGWKTSRHVIRARWALEATKIAECISGDQTIVESCLKEMLLIYSLAYNDIL